MLKLLCDWVRYSQCCYSQCCYCQFLWSWISSQSVFFLITGATDKSQNSVPAVAKILSKSFWCSGLENGYKLCQPDFPAIKILLSIFATLSVSSAAAERSFSTLRLIKSDLRTTMGQARLDNLCLVYIRNDILISTGVTTLVDMIFIFWLKWVHLRQFA